MDAYQLGKAAARSKQDTDEEEWPDARIQPRPGIHAAKDDTESAKYVETWLREFENNLGKPLHNIPILANTRQIGRNVARYYIPTTPRQIPSRAARLATFAVPPLGLWQLLNVINAARTEPEPGDNFYSPWFSTINIDERIHPYSLAHELGHYFDDERGEGAYPRTLLGGQRKEDKFPGKYLRDELAATLFARKALGPWWRQVRPHASTALAEYLYYEPARRTLMEWLTRQPKIEPDPNWRENLAKVLQDPTNRVRGLLSAIEFERQKETEEDLERPLIEINERGNYVWAGKSTKGLKELADKLIRLEYDRVYGKK